MNSSKPIVVVAEPVVPEVNTAEPPELAVGGLSEDPLWMNDYASDGGLFTQLDSMMSAIQTESNAMDNMRDKLKELDNMKTQISNLSKRLLEADQVNLTMKGTVITLQESCADLKRKKAESDSTIGPLRIELTRAKEMLGKERSGRLALQQELVSYKDQCSRLEKLNDELQAECHTIPGYVETCELLKNDLSKARKQFKSERNDLIGKLRMLERENVDTEALQGEVKNLALRLLDVSTNGKNGGNGNGRNVGGGVPLPTVSSMSPSMYQYRNRDQHHSGTMRDSNSMHDSRSHHAIYSEYDEEDEGPLDTSGFDVDDEQEHEPLVQSKSNKEGKGHIVYLGNEGQSHQSASASAPSSHRDNRRDRARDSSPSNHKARDRARDNRRQNEPGIYVSKGLKDLAKKERVKKHSASSRSMEGGDTVDRGNGHGHDHSSPSYDRSVQEKKSQAGDEELEKMNAFMLDHGQSQTDSSQSHQQPVHESRHARKIRDGTSFPKI